MKIIWTSGFLLLATVANAAPATYKKSGPDPQGLSTFWVKCENGNVSTVQCHHNVSRCGAASDQPLTRAATLACDSIQGLMMEPARK